VQFTIATACALLATITLQSPRMESAAKKTSGLKSTAIFQTLGDRAAMVDPDFYQSENA